MFFKEDFSKAKNNKVNGKKMHICESINLPLTTIFISTKYLSNRYL